MTDFPFELHVDGNKTLYRTRSRLLVAFKDKMPINQAEQVLGKFQLIIESGTHDALPSSVRPQVKINHSEKRFWVKAAGNNTLFATTVKTMEVESEIDWIAPVYRMDGAAAGQEYVCPLPNVLMIRPHSDAKAELLKRLVSKYNIHELFNESGRKGYRYYFISDPKSNSSYKMMSILQYLSDVRFECIPMVVPAAVPENACAIENKTIPALSAMELNT